MKQGWEDKTLKDIGTIFNGNSINAKLKKEKYFGAPDGLSYVATKDVGYDSSIDYENGVKIPFSEIDSFRIAPKNSVLICAEGGSAGRKIGRTNQDICFVNKLFAIVPQNETTSKFVYYWYKSETFQKEFKSRLTGLIGGVSKKKFETIPIPIPPLDEQKRIVAKIDEAFEAIDKATKNVEKNLKNAKELFQSHKNDIFRQIEITVGRVLLPSVCDEIFAGGDAPKANYSKEKTDKYKIPIFANAVKNNGLYGFTNIIRASKPSVTIAARGSGTGHTEIRNEPFFPIVRLIVITPNIKSVNLEFLKYSIENFDIMRSGSAIPQLTVPMIKGYTLPLPTIFEQKQIVKQLDELKEHTLLLESHYQQELDALDELKNSILQRAFEGEL